MTVEFWLGQEYDENHERKAVVQLLRELENQFGGTEETIYLFANVWIGSNPIDLIILKQDAIIVVELKQFSEPFTATQNGPWLSDSGSMVRAGRFQNPFQQVSSYRGTFIEYLRKNQHKFLRSGKIDKINFNHAHSIVAVSPSLPQVEFNFPDRIIWFELVGLDELVPKINYHRSNEIHISSGEIRKLLGKECLNLNMGDIKTGDMWGKVFRSRMPRGSLPSLPNLIIGRENELKELKQRIGIRNISQENFSLLSPQILTAMRGWPGVGKTTLAAMLAHDPDVFSTFQDGIFWVALGEEPNIDRDLRNIGYLVGESFDEKMSIVEIKDALTGYFSNKRSLFIIDDVWKAEHGTACLIGGRYCSTLFTTRFNAVVQKLANSKADIYNLNVLDNQNGIKLLRQLAPLAVKNHYQLCQELVEELEGLPLALRVAGHLLSRQQEYGFSVEELLYDLKDTTAILSAEAPADRSDLLTHTTPTVAALLRKSTDLLSEDNRLCFAMLGAFAAKPATFSMDEVAERIWGVPVREAMKIVEELVGFGLLEFIDNRYQIHALLVMHARTLFPE